MNSIPAALTWELFARGRWALPAAALGALAFPVLTLSALMRDGALLSDDPSALMLHVIFVQFNLLAFGGHLIALQWHVSRLYVYPASTAHMVTWRLLPAMLAMVVETLLWTAAINALFDLDWPLWGPALASGSVVAVALASLWLPGSTRWAVVVLCFTGPALGTWFITRYGTLRDAPTHLWNTVTPAELLTLAALALVSWRIAVVGVARSRRGEPAFSLGLVAWLERVFSRAPAKASALATPARAQGWYAWRFGWLAPGIVAGVLFVALSLTLIVWGYGNVPATQLVECALVCKLLPIIGSIMSGVALGNLSNRGDLVMGQFLATRPLTCADIAAAILRTLALSLFLAWAVWALAVVAAYGLGVALSDRPISLITRYDHWRVVPPAIVASWIISSVLASALLMGKSTRALRVLIAAFFAWIAFVVVAKYALTPAARDQAHRFVTILVGGACLIGTLWAFAVALRRQLIERSVAWVALAGWATLVVAAALLARTTDVPVAGYVLLVGVLALAVLPLAAAPLAIAKNRHR